MRFTLFFFVGLQEIERVILGHFRLLGARK